MNKTLNFLFLGLAWLSMQPLPAQSLKLNESGYFDGLQQSLPLFLL